KASIEIIYRKRRRLSKYNPASCLHAKLYFIRSLKRYSQSDPMCLTTSLRMIPQGCIATTHQTREVDNIRIVGIMFNLEGDAFHQILWFDIHRSQIKIFGRTTSHPHTHPSEKYST